MYIVSVFCCIFALSYYFETVVMARNAGCLSVLLLCLMSLSVQADEYDAYNYRPENSGVKIDQTNLPIVFIDTRHGGEKPNIIHKDYVIPARMKVIMNDDGTNYGDTLLHPGQKTDYEGWISIRYRGNTSFSASEKKPYAIRTLESDDVEGKKQKVSIMGMPKDNKWAMLAPFNDRSQIRDVLIFQLTRPYFDYVPRVRHCEVILDGIYYGIYVMAERPSKGKHRLNLDDPGDEGDALTGGYLLEVDRNYGEEHYYRSKYVMKDKNGRPYSYNNRIVFQYKHPDYDEMMPDHPHQLQYIQNQIELMENALLSSNFTDPETGYRHYLDPMSFIDQQLAQEVSGNVDGYRLSTNIYKQRDSQNPLFRTTLWDFNLAFGNTSYNHGTDTDYWLYQNTYIPATDYKVPFWWSRMMEDAAYVLQLKERWAEYRNGTFSNERLFATVDSLVSLLEDGGALERNNTAFTMFGGKQIWPVPNVWSVNTYDKEIAHIKKWLSDRIAWLDQQLEFDQTGITMPGTTISQQISGYYSLSGIRQQQRPQKGACIVRYSDGSSRVILAR